MINGTPYVCMGVSNGFCVGALSGVGEGETVIIVELLSGVVELLWLVCAWIGAAEGVGLGLGVDVYVGRGMVCRVTGCNVTVFMLAIFVIEVILFQSFVNWML